MKSRQPAATLKKLLIPKGGAACPHDARRGAAAPSDMECRTPKLKICGLTRETDIDAALANGTDYLGFVLYDKSPRHVPIEKLKTLLAHLNRRAPAVGVFVNPTDSFLRRAMSCGLDIAQLHGDEPEDFFRELPFPVWKTHRLQTDGDLSRALKSPAEKILIDANCGQLYGGTGQLADWKLAARLARQRAVILAGGINAQNIRQAAVAVRPFALDISSGVETAPGIKDPEKLKNLFTIFKKL